MAEVFRFANLSVDVDAAWRLIREGSLPEVRRPYPVEPWATQVLMLDRTEAGRKRQGVFVRLNHAHVATLPESRMSDPLLAVFTRFGWLLADGNHRVAKAYLEGREALEACWVGQEHAAAIVHERSIEARVREPRDFRRTAGLRGAS